jgi:hypothetical protein
LTIILENIRKRTKLIWINKAITDYIKYFKSILKWGTLPNTYTVQLRYHEFAWLHNPFIMSLRFALSILSFSTVDRFTSSAIFLTEIKELEGAVSINVRVGPPGIVDYEIASNFIL